LIRVYNRKDDSGEQEDAVGRVRIRERGQAPEIFDQHRANPKNAGVTASKTR
jgi:hypothetical protein